MKLDQVKLFFILFLKNCYLSIKGKHELKNKEHENFVFIYKYSFKI